VKQFIIVIINSVRQKLIDYKSYWKVEVKIAKRSSNDLEFAPKIFEDQSKARSISQFLLSYRMKIQVQVHRTNLT
jgi:hypothetical protein